MKWLKRLAKLFLFLYTLLCGVLYFMQEKLIFRPDSLAESFQFWEGEEVEIQVEEGVFLNAVWIRTARPKGVILYWHGNKGSNRRCLRQAEGMMGNGYDILMVDYRGFGKSDGKMESEEQMFGDAQKAYDWLKERYDESNIAMVGYSLGTGPASYLAAQNKPRALVLLAPYTSLVEMKNQIAWFTPDFLLKYPFRNAKYLEETTCPITLFHGTNDNVIPFENSIVLKAAQPYKVTLVRLNGVSHRGLIFAQEFKRRLPDLLE